MNQPFFIVGCSRSGTTMLSLMMNMHKNIHIPKESWFLSDVMDRFTPDNKLSEADVNEIFELTTSHWRWKEWEMSDKALKERLSVLVEPSLNQVVEVIFHQTMEKAGKIRWGDKTPGYVTEIRRIYNLFPNAKFLHLLRDGRDVSISLKRVGWVGDTTWDIASHWSEQVRAGCEQGRSLPKGQYLELKYEDLVRNTEAKLREICEFLGEEYSEQMMGFYNQAEKFMPKRDISHLMKTHRPPREDDLERWKREMNRVQLFIFESISMNELLTFAYVPKYPGWIKKFSIVFDQVKRLIDFTLPLRKRIGIKSDWLKKWV